MLGLRPEYGAGHEVDLVLLGIDLLTWAAMSLAVWRWLTLRSVERLERPVWRGEARPDDDSLLGADLSAVKTLARARGRDAAGSPSIRHARFEGLAPLVGARGRRLEGGLATLAVIAAVLPMLGLLGTVFGMVRSFASLESGDDPAGLSGGVGSALLTTQSGLVSGLAVLVVHGVLRAKARRVTARREAYLRRQRRAEEASGAEGAAGC